MIPAALRDFLAGAGDAITIRVEAVYGSAPREVGAWMVVSACGAFGTIGGGRLEQMAMMRARAMLTAGKAAQELDVPLGPEIGQCCGGRVRLSLLRTDAAALLRMVEDDWAARPAVYILGAGHVGRALCDLLQHMPFRTTLVDSRAGELALSGAEVEQCLTPLPEAQIDAALPGSAFVILTHDHGLDFLLTSAALNRGDAAYIGLIGSATKRTRFERWYGQPAPALICPIGGQSADKRPQVIAAMTLAEVVRALKS